MPTASDISSDPTGRNPYGQTIAALLSSWRALGIAVSCSSGPADEKEVIALGFEEDKVATAMPAMPSTNVCVQARLNSIAK